MHRLLLIMFVSCLTLGLRPLLAEEQVTLKSGTRLIGSVTLNGQTVDIKIGDAQLQVPLGEVDLIASVGTEAKQSPERLLMIALEARAQQGTSAGQVGLLAEAYRQAPNDARIAYWYAHSLADAGLGNAANAVLQKHYAAIEQAFPGVITQLVDHIRARMALEFLPADMRDKVDQINSSIRALSVRSDRQPVFVRFRLTDSTGQPVDKSAVRVSSNGNDERLDAYENGYYLLTFNSYRNDEDPHCKLTVSSPGLEAREFELQPSADKVANGGDLVVKRYVDADKLPLTVIISDQEGQTLKDASVTLRPQDRDDENAVQTTSTDADGRATFNVFPMTYVYSVTAKGFKSESGGIELKRGADEQEPRRVKLYPAISATIRFAWSTTSFQGDGGTTSNETTIEVGQSVPPMPYGPDTMHILRPVQVGDKLTLQSGPPYFGGPMAAGMSTWARQMPGELVKDSPLESFTVIDLKKLEEIKDAWQAVKLLSEAARRGPYQPLSFEIEQGQIYVGQAPGRDMRTGQPTLVSFKAFVEQVSTAGESK